VSEAGAGRDDDQPPDVSFVVDLPEGWCPPPAAAQAILRVMLAVQQRRDSSTDPFTPEH